MSRLQTILSQLSPLQILAHSPLFKFEQFPKLPLEIQTMVWKRTARHPRLIKIFEIETPSTPYGPDFIIEGYTVNPGIMGACKESRKAGFKVYRLFATRVPDPYTGKPVTIYINFRADIFFLDATSWPVSPRHIPQPIQPRTYTPANNYNWDVKYIERIERLIQLFPEDGPLQLPSNLLKVARIKEYHVRIDFNIKDEKDALEDGVLEDLVRRDFERKYEEIFVTRMREESMDRMTLGSLNYELMFHGDSYGCDLVPAPPTDKD
ncbi:hypothetical protein DL98DRAFT_540791 [Cadophora sp. DSE1049]|nr:hypothetical protein DL98DRAFT_540791 [Cadophora sp. DSE1049]